MIRIACLRVQGVRDQKVRGERAEAKTIPVGSWAEIGGAKKKARCANKLLIKREV